MREGKSWDEVVAGVERSGLNLQREMQMLNQERQFQVQQELVQQINEAIQRRSEVEKRKKFDRLEVQSESRKITEKDRKSRLEYREREQNFRRQNLQLIKQKSKDQPRNPQNSPPPQQQNPITATLYGKSDTRNRKLKQYNKEYDEINYELMRNRLKTQQEIKRMNQLEKQKFCDHVESTFNKIEQQRYKFKKNCLEGGYISAKKLTTEPDSLEKQYSIYLEQQIAEKKARQDYNRNIFKSQLDDRIVDMNIIRINQNPEVQSSSPAYLGRIPYNYDRQRQLDYLNRDVKGHQRTKTEISVPVKSVNQERPEPPTNFSNKSEPVLHPQLLPMIATPERQSNPKPPPKDYKYFNIITGNMILRREPSNPNAV